VTAIQILIIMVPVMFFFMGFALDLGQLYVVNGELKTAANSMAVAAAEQLIGTDASTGNAASAAQLTLDDSSGAANKYNFGSLVIGQQNGNLTSTAAAPAFYADVADALGTGGTGDTGNTVGGAAARHAKVTISAEVPLTFWTFIPINTAPKTTVAVQAVAGMSAPLCVACGIEPFAVAPLNAGDATDFGFVPGNEYTFAYLCNGAPTPAVLTGTTGLISYLLLNRYDTTTTILPSEDDQLYRDGAAGLPGSATQAQSCFLINNVETIWQSALPLACARASVAPSVTEALCGLDTRFDQTPPAVCAGIANIDSLSSIYSPDSDTSLIADYTQYQGTGRRVITIPVVDTLNPTGSMTVLGFRQFLVEPNLNAVDINPADNYGRFGALYIGSVMPVKQGRFDGCQQTAGPGKVVLHQ